MAQRPATPEEVGPEWARLLRLLPGYDPFRSPGGAWFDAEAAQRAVMFIHECITHVEGALAGEPFLLEDWQRSWVCNLFGWQRQDRKGRIVRRFRETLLYIPRKNGKTPLAAAVALYIFFCDREAGQQNYIAAADREQAGMLFRQAKGMVEGEPELAARCKPYGGNASAGQSRSLVREEDGSYLRVISADANSKHGGNPHLVLIDELHAQPNPELVGVLATSMASENRKQSLTIHITTADFDRPSVCNEKHAYACKVRDGIIDDPAYLPAIWETPQDADWTDPAVWARANPNLGVSVSLEYMERETKRAKEEPSYENMFKRLHLNMKTATDTKAIDLAAWDALPESREEELLGQPCWGGLDLASTTDLAAFSLTFNLGEGKRATLTWLWSPKATARKRSKTDRVPYEAWAAAGLIKLTEGSVIDYDVIRRDINAIGQRFAVKKIAADRWNATQILTQLMGDGFEVVAFGQGFASMTAPTKEVMALIASGKLMRPRGECMRWQAGNLATEEDAAGNLKPSKNKSADKIDGPVSLIMSVGLAMTAPESGSVYDGRGIEVL